MTVLLKESMVYPLKEDRCFMTADQQARLAHGHHQPLVLPQGPLLDGTGNEIPDEEVGKAIVKWKTRKEKPVLMNEDGTPDYCAEAQFARNASMELHGQNFIIFAAREGLKRDEKTKEFTETFWECHLRHLSEEYGIRYHTEGENSASGASALPGPSLM